MTPRKKLPEIPETELTEIGDRVYNLGMTTMEVCTWLVEVPTASLYPPEAEWYPDSAADVYTLVECGAPVHPTHGGAGYRCDNGHEHLPLEIEYAPGGPAWQREQLEATA